MEKQYYYASPSAMRALSDMEHIWKYYVAPFRIAPHVWSVGGNDDVCCYLIDTGDGLILIDTGMEQTTYLLVDSIWRAGFNPRDITKILLTHWHGDHVNGARLMKEMIGAKLYISHEDEIMHQLHAADTKPFITIPYEVDCFYSDLEPIIQGRIAIHTRLTPGHTPGATSLFFDDTDWSTGETFHCAMHGGLGINQMKPESLLKDRLPEEQAHRFISDCLMMKSQQIDITIPSHMNQINLKPNIQIDFLNYRPFIAPYVWGDLMQNRAEAVMEFYPGRYHK